MSLLEIWEPTKVAFVGLAKDGFEPLGYSSRLYDSLDDARKNLNSHDEGFLSAVESQGFDFWVREWDCGSISVQCKNYSRSPERKLFVATEENTIIRKCKKDEEFFLVGVNEENNIIEIYEYKEEETHSLEPAGSHKLTLWTRPNKTTLLA